MHSRQGFGVRGEVIKIRNKRTVALRLIASRAHADGSRASRSRLQRVESDHEIVRGIAALSDSYHRFGTVHDSRDATGERGSRSDLLSAAGGSQV